MKTKSMGNLFVLGCLLFVGHFSYAQNTSRFEHVKIDGVILRKDIIDTPKNSWMTVFDFGRSMPYKKSRYKFTLPKLKNEKQSLSPKVELLDDEGLVCNIMPSQYIEDYGNDLSLYMVRSGVMMKGCHPKSYKVTWEGQDESCREYDVRMPLPELEVSLTDAPAGSGVNKNLVITNVSDKNIELIPEKNRTEQYSIKTEGDNIIPIAAKDSYTLTIEPLDSCEISDLGKEKRDIVIRFAYTVDGAKTENDFVIVVDVSCDWSKEILEEENRRLEEENSRLYKEVDELKETVLDLMEL